MHRNDRPVFLCHLLTYVASVEEGMQYAPALMKTSTYVQACRSSYSIPFQSTYQRSTSFFLGLAVYTTGDDVLPWQGRRSDKD